MTYNHKAQLEQDRQDAIKRTKIIGNGIKTIVNDSVLTTSKPRKKPKK